jgi:peptidoglycan/xylan/chitin deacetylase (PgdA/CDA1 family)
LKKLNAGNISIIDEIADVLEIDFGKLTTEFKPYLSLRALKKLHYEGFHIGSHGFDHKEFQLMQPSEMKQQIEESFSWLETHLKIEKRIFSFPFTDHNISLSFFEYLQNEANVLLSFGTAGLKYDSASRHIQRIPAEMHGFTSLRQILKAEYLYYLAKKPVNKNLIVRK